MHSDQPGAGGDTLTRVTKKPAAAGFFVELLFAWLLAEVEHFVEAGEAHFFGRGLAGRGAEGAIAAQHGGELGAHFGDGFGKRCRRLHEVHKEQGGTTRTSQSHERKIRAAMTLEGGGG